MVENAKEVYSFDLQRTIDRTKEKHPLGKFDVDFRKLNASNPQAREWTYGTSARTIEKARKSAERIEDETSAETRIVDAMTGEVLA